MHHIHHRNALTPKATRPSKIRPTKAFFMEAAATERQKSVQKEIQASTQPIPGSETPTDQHFNSNALIDYPGKHV